MRRPVERLSQKQLALELRYAIDTARRIPRSDYIATVRTLMEEHPYGTTSRHVEHNLGDARLEWLYENGLLPEPRLRTGEPGQPVPAP